MQNRRKEGDALCILKNEKSTARFRNENVTVFYGSETHMPEYLEGHGDDYDYLLIAHYSRFEEIREQAVGLRIPEEKIIMPYEV